MQARATGFGFRTVRAAALCAVVALGACQTAPITGRQQLVLISAEQADQLGVQAYGEIKTKQRISREPQMNRAVQQVAARLAPVANRPGYQWEYTVFEDAEPNAFALPGGKIGVNTGLFKVARTDAQLAAVIGHEIGHVIANHVAERLSRQALLQAGLQAAGAAGAGQYVDLMAQAATLGIVLPFSRQQESEADEIGLILMARAGYDPRAAVELWRNFDAYGGQRPPEFLSDHPSSGTRIQRLEALMPRAMAEFQARR
jgi:metalloendopeptidase OMA1, mitochondrial